MVLAACTGGGPHEAVPAAASLLSPGPAVQAAWVQVGPQGQAVARAIVAGAECPRI